MQIKPAELSKRERYAWTISSVIPRPIGWVSTLSDNDVPNLAPFSFFGAVTADPPTLMLSVGRRRGEHKDTAVNLLHRREAVVHIPTVEQAQAMVKTSSEVDASIDEFKLAGLTTTPSEHVAPSRIANAPLSMECTLISHQTVGKSLNDLFLLEVVCFHADDEILDPETGFPCPKRLHAVGRLGSSHYTHSDQVVSIPRP